MLLHGGCCCGAVRYETSGMPYHQTICHCPTCRRTAGAASMAWFSVERSTYRITQGAPGRYQSSPTVTRSFCGQCGTQLTYENNELNGDLDITICSLDDPEALAPADHTFTAYRLGWDRASDGLPEYPQLRSGA